MNVSGSAALAPKTKLDISRVSASDAMAPITTPARASFNPQLSTINSAGLRTYPTAKTISVASS